MHSMLVIEESLEHEQSIEYDHIKDTWI